MNNLRLTVIIHWQTRSQRHCREMIKCAKDYGFLRPAKNLFVGRLNRKELQAIKRRVHSILAHKRDEVYFLVVCKSCFALSDFKADLKSGIQPRLFEIV